MNNVIPFNAPFRPITGYFEPKIRGQVVPIHTTKQGKAQGVFAAINIAARRMGFSDRFALEYARRAREDYNVGTRSSAAVISDWTATMRAVTRKVQA